MNRFIPQMLTVGTRIARACIAAIVRDTEAQFIPQLGWPLHPLDAEPGEDL
jgi:hypothetical protein